MQAYSHVSLFNDWNYLRGLLMPGNGYTWKVGKAICLLNSFFRGRVGMDSGSLYENPSISFVGVEAELPLTPSTFYPADLLC